MAEPALRRDDQAVGLQCPPLPRIRAKKPAALLLFPWQGRNPIGKFPFGWQIDGRGQERLAPKPVCRHRLGDRHNLWQAVFCGACDRAVAGS